ncbi:unnamed protein product [Clonostachys solani]|uniref:SGNH hydrolase-type esterase domain-containing protein n=1 Tax=Clonostachys solani TaxID=160281 RepID=A0A9N9W7M2_9HYPO|nr:unnamed protein product [Clonostachys solani]
MAPVTPGLRRIATRLWNAWTTYMMFALVAYLFCAPVLGAPIANDVELRVLLIGDSITRGSGSSPINGYRKVLYELLTQRGNKVDMVGSVIGEGDMVDNDHEGHRGMKISEITTLGLKGIYSGANIVLLHAGTNNMKNDNDADIALTDLEFLIALILRGSPNAVVFVATIVPSTTASINNRINTFNKGLPGLVNDFGKNVVLVPINEAVSLGDMNDELHPNNEGYRKMAQQWYKAIQEADAQKLISKPSKERDPPNQGGTKCLNTPDLIESRKIAMGPQVVYNDGNFKQGWKKIGVIAEGYCPRGRLHFPDLDGDGLRDYACVGPQSGAVTASFRIPRSDGEPSAKWTEREEIATGASGRNGSGVKFADLNGDGRDDYVWIDPNTGDFYGWINKGRQNGGWLWHSIGKIANNIGASAAAVQFVDIDGDGRDDLLHVSGATGQTKAWLNSGAGDMPNFYMIGDNGVIATGESAQEGDTVILGDFTGKGRADYMIVQAGGKVKGLVNRRQEKFRSPRWLSPVAVADGPEGAKQSEVRLVDMTGDGKVDYLLVDEKTGQVTLWENTGTGGKYQGGDGVFLCDCKDLISFLILLDGKGWGYLNKGKGRDIWENLGKIAEAPNGHRRENLRMGVLTKSKRADYIVVDPDTGKAVWYENSGEAGGWQYVGRGTAADGPVQTLASFGLKMKGENVRFAERRESKHTDESSAISLDGDGLDDYVYVGEQGATVVWKNMGTVPITWGAPRKVADGPGVLPQEVHFADVTGDGKLDYVSVHRITGHTRAWLHRGWEAGGDLWQGPVVLANGIQPGHAVKIAEMTGDKRADYVSVEPDTGALSLWKNVCIVASPPANPGSPGPFPGFIERPSTEMEEIIAQASKDYNGINWTLALDSDCTEEELKILVEGTYAAFEMASYGSAPVDHHKNLESMEIWQTAAFNRYFRGSYTALEQWRANSAAFTLSSVQTTGWPEIVFCPQFFRREEAAKLAKNEVMRKPSSYYMINYLDSWERTILHEWMHFSVDLMEQFAMLMYGFQVTDESGIFEGREVKIYGDYWTYRFAHDMTRDVNPVVASNADNYAWYFLYNFYHIKWKWTSDGNFSPGGSKREFLPSVGENATEPSASKRDSNDGQEGIDDSTVGDSPHSSDKEALHRRADKFEMGININPLEGKLDHMMIDYVDAEYDVYKRHIDQIFWSPVSGDCFLT